jgi:hypothetical protein
LLPELDVDEKQVLRLFCGLHQIGEKL